jgi:sec-independent protein translocase protein TatA
MGLDNPVHILLLLIVLLLVFGAKRLPEIGRSLGEGMRGFKDSLSGASSHDSLSQSVAAPQPAPAPVPAPSEPAGVEKSSQRRA